MNFRENFFARAAIIFCAVLISLHVAAQTAPPRLSIAEESVRITFTSFKHALLARDGTRAARFIDDDTAMLYEKIRRAALDAPKDELLKSTLFFQVAVLGIRQVFTKSDIENISGRDLYGKTVSAGADSGAMGLETLSIAKVHSEPKGLSAYADLGMEGRAETFRIKFLIQQGQWRIYLLDLITIASDEYQARFGLSPKTPASVMEDVVVKYLFPVLALQSGKPVGAEIWVPLAQRP